MLTPTRRRFYQRWFLAATIYNTVWGIAVILFPRVPFDMAGIALPKPDELTVQFWQCIGMFVMVFAIGYWYLYRDPERYAPFALIALLGKIFGPIGFVYGYFTGTMPGIVGLTIITNDLIWWPAFGMFVYETMWRDRNPYPVVGSTSDR